MDESYDWLDGLEDGTSENLYILSSGALGTEQLTGTQGFLMSGPASSLQATINPSGITPVQSAQSVGSSISSAASSILPSSSTIAEYGVGVIIVLVLVFLILGKVDSL